MSGTDPRGVHGRSDPDIQRAVDQAQPQSVAVRVAMENSLQRRRNERWRDDADGPFHTPWRWR